MSEQVQEVDYNLPKLSKSKWIISIGVIFFLAIFIYFPVSNKIEGLIKGALAKNPNCAISYESINFEFLLPKLVISNLNIPGACISREAQDILIKKTFLNIRGISFTPFGPHFLLETTLLKSPIEAYFTIGFSKAAINLQETELNLKELSKYIPKLKLAGKVKIDALIEISTSGIEDLKAHIMSKNLSVPAQNISGLGLKTMNINNLLIKAEKSGKNEINIKQLVVGDTDSPIRANFTGPIKINNRNFGYSNLKLKGEVAFSKSFIKDYSVINLVMGRFTKKDDFYQIQLTGPLSRPNPSSPR